MKYEETEGSVMMYIPGSLELWFANRLFSEQIEMICRIYDERMARLEYDCGRQIKDAAQEWFARQNIAHKVDPDEITFD